MSLSCTLEGLRGWEDAPRYDLTDVELSERTSELVSTRAPADMTGRYNCFVLGADEAAADLARTVECRVFDEAFGNDAAEMNFEYSPYESSSLFLIVVDRQENRPAGAIRIIRSSESGLKTLNDISEPTGVTAESFMRDQGIESLDKCWDVGTLAVLPEYRGLSNRFEVSTMLYRSLFLLGMQEGAEHAVTVLDSKARVGLDMLGVPLKDMEGTSGFAYLGSSKSYAMHCRFDEFIPAVNQRAAELESKRTMVAKLAGSLATGAGIDENVSLKTVH